VLSCVPTSETGSAQKAWGLPPNARRSAPRGCNSASRERETAQYITLCGFCSVEKGVDNGDKCVRARRAPPPPCPPPAGRGSYPQVIHSFSTGGVWISRDRENRAAARFFRFFFLSKKVIHSARRPPVFLGTIPPLEISKKIEDFQWGIVLMFLCP